MPGFIIPRRVLPPPTFNGPIVMNRDSWQAEKLAFWQAGLSFRNLVLQASLGTATSVPWGVYDFGLGADYPADGSVHVTSYPDRDEYDFTTSLTVVGWMINGSIPFDGLAGASGWFGTIAKKDGNYILRRAESAGENNIGTAVPRWSALWFDGTNLRQLSSTVAPVALAVNHVAMVISGNDIAAVYVNGVGTTGTRTWFAAGQTLTNALEIGGSAAGFNEALGGILWDVRLYSYALSEGQVRTLYEPPSRWDLYAASRPLRTFFDMGAIVRRFLLVR